MLEQEAMEYFYGGFLQENRSLLDAVAGGCLVNKTPTKARTKIANMVWSAKQYQQQGEIKKEWQRKLNEHDDNFLKITELVCE